MTAIQYFFFLIGQVAMMSLARFFFQWIIKFSTLETATGSLFAAGTVGAVLLGFRLFDGLTDPIAGVLSDRWVQKGNKRNRLLLYTFLLPGIGLMLCFLPSESMSGALRWATLVTGMTLFFIGYTFYGIPLWSLIDDYSQGQIDVRRRLSNLLGAGILIATAIGFVISPIVVEYFGFFTAACIFSLFASIGMLAPMFAEPKPLDDFAESPAASLLQARSPLGDFFQALKQPRFLGLILLLGGSQMSFTIMTSAAPFIAVDLLHGTASDVSLLLGPLLGAALPCFFFAPVLSKRFGWETVLVASSLLLGVVYVLCSSVGTSIIFSPFVTAVLLFALGGPMVAMLLALEGEAITDCAAEAGSGLTSLYFGVYNLVVKGFNGFAIFLAGFFAELSQGQAGNTAIRWMIATAGVSLFCGMTAYLLIGRLRRRSSQPGKA